MALINCPDCKKEVSDQAPTCPNCGRPFKGASKLRPEVKVKRQKEGCFLQTLNAGCIIIFAIIGFIIFVLILGGLSQ